MNHLEMYVLVIARCCSICCSASCCYNCIAVDLSNLVFVTDSCFGPLCEFTITLCIFLNEPTCTHLLPMPITASVVPLNLPYVYYSAAADIVKINSMHLKAGCLLATAKNCICQAEACSCCYRVYLATIVDWRETKV